MTTLASSQATNVEVYEDMFKEITRKLYGEETGHGLLTLGTPVAHVATAGPTVPEGERSFTTLVWRRCDSHFSPAIVFSPSPNLLIYLTTSFILID